MRNCLLSCALLEKLNFFSILTGYAKPTLKNKGAVYQWLRLAINTLTNEDYSAYAFTADLGLLDIAYFFNSY